MARLFKFGYLYPGYLWHRVRHLEVDEPVLDVLALPRLPESVERTNVCL